jgi:hypothetical protein
MRSLIEFLDRARRGDIGFQMSEVMSGWHEFEPGFGPIGRHEMEFRVDWGPRRLSQWKDPTGGPFLTQPLEGTVTIGGLCREAPCRGTLDLRYLREHRLRYVFEFEADGRCWRFTGEKVNVRPWNLPVSHTTCFGVLVDVKSGALASRSVTHFRLRSIPAFLGSFRLV